MDNTAVDRITPALLAAMLLVAFLLGGGGIGSALANLTVQMAALVLLAVRPGAALRFWHESPLVLRVLIIGSIALPLLQIVPLPVSVWSALPRRSLVTSSLELIGGDTWMPLSVDPLRTLLALTALITPIAVLLVGWDLRREQLISLGWGIVGLGIVTVLLGVAQLSGATDEATFYGSRAPGQILLGTFANRNSTGLFLTFALGLAALLPAPRPHPAVLPIRLALCALLLLAVVLTQSRTALVLALLPVTLGALHALTGVLRKRENLSAGRAFTIAAASAALLAAALGVVMIASPERIAATIERFEAKDDPRRFIWDDATYSASRYWPLGAGMGSFDEVYQVDESLENLTLRRAGRAHNDYIELTIEAGMPGLILAALWLMLIGWLSWRIRASSQRWTAWAGSAFMLAIALQSITDYPLRNHAILALAGFALLLLTRIGADQARARP